LIVLLQQPRGGGEATSMEIGVGGSLSFLLLEIGVGDEMRGGEREQVMFDSN
jgi:hypothetical protein